MEALDMNRLDSPELNTSVRLNRSSFLLISSLILLGTLLLLSAVQASADPYFNSSEPGCNGSDPNKVFCEDFETTGVSGGRWYAEDCDTANANGGINLRTKGWCGTIYANPITPAGAEICGAAGVGTNCAGNHGTHIGDIGGVNMAEHAFKSQSDEIYVRYYQKWLTGYVFGQEKVLTFNMAVGGGIKWGNLHISCGAGGTSSVGNLQWNPIGISQQFTSCLDITSITPGNWYYIEVHAKLSTTNSSGNGSLQVWVNNCGAKGTACGASPTLRLNLQNLSWNRNNSAELFGALWFENWSSPASIGTSYIDQIVVSRVPIGFMGGFPSPLNLKVQ